MAMGELLEESANAGSVSDWFNVLMSLVVEQAFNAELDGEPNQRWGVTEPRKARRQPAFAGSVGPVTLSR